jgi:signal transduction histidine kinase
MKIKTQSIVLMAGIAAVPIIVISAFLLVQRLVYSAKQAEVYAKMAQASTASSVDEWLGRLVKEKPAGLDMAISDPAGRVVYSTMPGVRAGDDVARSLATLSRSPPDGKIVAIGFTPPLPTGYTAVVTLPRSDFLPVNLRNDFVLVAIIALAAILGFAAIMSILILRSITNSVLDLEKATARVAAGELDIPIATGGGNEIASVCRSLDSLRAEIKDDRARRARFIMGISHDLKTPLALIKGYSEAVEGEIEGAAAASYLTIIQDKADQLEGMIDDLIDFERLGTGEWSRGLVDSDFRSFLLAFARRAQADAELLGRAVRYDVDLPAPSMVRMDDRLVSRALENIVNNSLRYTAPGGKIGLTARSEKDRISVVIEDDGPGIPPADRHYVFEPFYRGSASRREQGMGLGLSIVKTVIESHGWTIELDADRTSGVAFTLGIPLGEARTT